VRCPPPTGKPPQRHHPWAKLTASALAGPQQVANSEESRARAAPSGTQRPLLLPTRTGRGESRTPSPVGHAAARPPFHPRSTVAVAAGAHDGSQQLHATLTPLQGLQDQCRAEARQGVVGVLSDCAAPPSPAMRTALSDLVAAVTEYRVTRCGATLLSTRDTRPQPRQKFTCSIEGVRVN
jgi:hypothetical protein